LKQIVVKLFKKLSAVYQKRCKEIYCGFTTGARFILIKRTDSTGDWYVRDTARGINTSANYIFLAIA
jgi:hypothetical protein